MPLFMLISGFCTYNISRITDFHWLVKRAKVLMVPFVIWCVLPYVVNGMYDYRQWVFRISFAFMDPDNGSYWFLFILFLNCCILFLVNKCSKIKAIQMFISLFIFLLLQLVTVSFNVHSYGMDALAFYSVFYFIGYFSRANNYNINIGPTKSNFVVLMVCISIYGIGLIQYSRTGIPNIILNANFKWQAQIWINTLYRIVIGVAGSLMFSFVVVMCNRIEKIHIGELLEILGKHTIEIYVLHLYGFGIIPYNGTNIYICVMIKVIGGFLFSFLIMKLIYGCRLELLLFGRGGYKGETK